MKRKFILLPIALTTLTPMIGMVGCNAETTSEPALVINDLEETYEGTAGQSDHTGKITVNLVEGETKTDVTNEVNFNISTEGMTEGILTWEKTEQWFTWTGTLSPKEEGYECSIQATFGSFISKTHTLLLRIHDDLTFCLTEFTKTNPEAVFSCSNVNLSPGIECKAYIDTEPHAEEWDWANGWNYIIADASDTMHELMVNKVSIDGADLDKIEEGLPDENQFIVVNEDPTHWVEGGRDLIGAHRVWITFTVKEELTNAKLMFVIGLQH